MALSRPIPNKIVCKKVRESTVVYLPLWKILVNGMIIPYIMENKKYETTNQYCKIVWVLGRSNQSFPRIWSAGTCACCAPRAFKTCSTKWLSHAWRTTVEFGGADWIWWIKKLRCNRGIWYITRPNFWETVLNIPQLGLMTGISPNFGSKHLNSKLLAPTHLISQSTSRRGRNHTGVSKCSDKTRSQGENRAHSSNAQRLFFASVHL